MIKWLIGLFLLDKYIDSKIDDALEDDEEGDVEEWQEEENSVGVVRVGCFLLLLVGLIGVIYALRQ